MCMYQVQKKSKVWVQSLVLRARTHARRLGRWSSRRRNTAQRWLKERGEEREGEGGRERKWWCWCDVVVRVSVSVCVWQRVVWAHDTRLDSTRLNSTRHDTKQQTHTPVFATIQWMQTHTLGCMHACTHARTHASTHADGRIFIQSLLCVCVADGRKWCSIASQRNNWFSVFSPLETYIHRIFFRQIKGTFWIDWFEIYYIYLYIFLKFYISYIGYIYIYTPSFLPLSQFKSAACFCVTHTHFDRFFMCVRHHIFFITSSFQQQQQKWPSYFF